MNQFSRMHQTIRTISRMHQTTPDPITPPMNTVSFFLNLKWIAGKISFIYFQKGVLTQLQTDQG